MQNLFKRLVCRALICVILFNSNVSLFAQNKPSDMTTVDTVTLLSQKQKELEDSIINLKAIANSQIAGNSPQKRAAALDSLKRELDAKVAEYHKTLTTDPVLRRAEEIKFILLNRDSAPLTEKELDEQWANRVLTEQEFKDEYKLSLISTIKRLAAAAKKEQASKGEFTPAEIDAYYQTVQREELAAMQQAYQKYQAEVKKLESAHEAQVQSALRALAADLMALYYKSPDKVRSYVIGLAPLLLPSAADIFSAKDKQALLSVARGRVKAPAAACLKSASCEAETDAVSILGSIGSLEDRVAITDLLEKTKTMPDIRLFLSGISALISLKAYGSVNGILSAASDKEHDFSDMDFLSVETHVENFAAWNGRYLGNSSRNFQYKYKDEESGKERYSNAWTDVAFILAQDGSPESLQILRTYGIQKCASPDGKGLRCSGITPFLVGALLSGKSGYQNYKFPYIGPGAYLGRDGRGGYTTQQDAARFNSRADALTANMRALAKQKGMNIEQYAALTIINSSMGDLGAAEENALDLELNKKFGKVISGKYSEYAVVNAKNFQAKDARQARVSAFRMLARTFDLGFTIWCFWDILKIAGRLGLRGWHVIQLARAGTKVKRLAYIRRNFVFLNGVALRAQARQATRKKVFNKIKNSMTTSVMADSRLYFSTPAALEVVKVQTKVPAMSTKTAVAVTRLTPADIRLTPSDNIFAAAPPALSRPVLPAESAVIKYGGKELELPQKVTASFKNASSGKNAVWVTNGDDFAQIPMEINLNGKVPGLKNTSRVKGVVISENGDWVHFVSQNGGKLSFKNDVSHFKIPLSAESAGALIAEIQKQPRALMDYLNTLNASRPFKDNNIYFKFTLERDFLASAKNKVAGLFTDKDADFVTHAVYDVLGREITGVKVRAVRDAKGIKFVFDGKELKAVMAETGQLVKGEITLPKNLLPAVGVLGKNNSGLKLSAQIKGTLNKTMGVMALSAVNIGVGSSGLLGVIDDTYTDDQLSPAAKVLITSALFGAANFASPAFAGIIKKRGAASALGISFGTTAVALSIPILNGFNGSIIEEGKEPNPWPLYITPVLLGASTALSKASIGAMTNAVDPTGVKFNLSLALKSGFNVGMVGLSAGVNTGYYLLKRSSKDEEYSPWLNNFSTYPTLAGVSAASLIGLRAMHLRNDIGRAKRIVNGSVYSVPKGAVSVAEQKELGKYIMPIMLGTGSMMAAENIVLNGYIGKQMNKTTGVDRKDVKYLINSAIMLSMPVLSRFYYKPVLNKLGGLDNPSSIYKFLGISSAGSVAATSYLALNDNDNNKAGFYGGAMLAAASFASNFALLNKLGGMHIKKMFPDKMVADVASGKFQAQFNATIGGGFLGGLAYTGYSKSRESHITPQEKALRPNASLQDGMWLPLLINGAALGFMAKSYRGTNLIESKVPVALKVPSAPRSYVFRAAYETNILKQAAEGKPVLSTPFPGPAVQRVVYPKTIIDFYNLKRRGI